MSLVGTATEIGLSTACLPSGDFNQNVTWRHVSWAHPNPSQLRNPRISWR